MSELFKDFKDLQILVLTGVAVVFFVMFAVGMVARGWGAIMGWAFVLGIAVTGVVAYTFLSIFGKQMPADSLTNTMMMVVLIERFVTTTGALVVVGGLGYGLKRLFQWLFNRRAPSHG